MVDGGDVRALADDPKESQVSADESPRMEEWTALDNKILKELGELPDLDPDKPL
jgi:hypothetical protein